MNPLPFSDTLHQFTGLSLDELNKAAGFMERIENKYLLSLDDVREILEALKFSYKILTINNHSIFTYDNVYLDTNTYHFHNQHEQNQKFRTKLRTRQYVESDLYYVEFKQKEQNAIRKFRYQTQADAHGSVTKEMQLFFDGLFQSLYGQSFKEVITPALRNTYKRITLCHIDNLERITIDFSISFSDLRNNNRTISSPMAPIAIIESKSGTPTPPSKRILEKFSPIQAKGCSKYCLGLYFLQKNLSFNHFLPTVSAIEAIASKTQKKTAAFSPLQEHILNR